MTIQATYNVGAVINQLLTATATTIDLSYKATGITVAPPVPKAGNTIVLQLLDRINDPQRSELISYTGRTGANPYVLTGVVRDVGGTGARQWRAGGLAVSVVVAENGLTLLKFMNATNRLAGLEYIDPTHTAVAHTFTSASIGQRGYAIDTKTFWDVSDVVDGVAVWVTATGIPEGGAVTQVITKASKIEGDVIWSDITKNTAQFIFDKSTINTTFTIVGAIRLASATYAAPLAEIGAGDPTKRATLQLRRQNGAVLCTIGDTVGGVSWQTADRGFTLPITTNIDLVLKSNVYGVPAILNGLSLYEGIEPGTSGGIQRNEYVHEQLVPATPWLVNHNLGFKPNVVCTSLAGARLLTNVKYLNSNQLLIETDEDSTGFAYCS